MAFALTVYYAVSGITSLTDKNPFGLESAEGLSGATISRWGQRSPQQSGMTDLGFRLQAREMTLRILFYATTAAALDTHRDTLTTMFGAQSSVVLRVTRDDGEIRQLTCEVVKDIAIDLVPEDRPGHLHRATVTLRAANPAWQATITSTTTYATQWWTAGGVIGTAQIREHVESPTNGQAWSWANVNTLTGDWAVAVTTGKHTGGSTHYVWDLSQAGRNFYKDTGGGYAYNGAGTTTWPGGTAANYHITENRSAVSYWKYWNGSAVATHSSFVEDVSLTDDGAWRSIYSGFGGDWTPAISRAVIFSDPTDTQLTALAPFILGSVTYGVTTINDGDLPVYPRIQLSGPITNPVLTNLATGGSINLTGLTLGSADTCIIDLRGGHKTLTDLNSNNLLGSVTTLPMSMADFYLAPSPIAANGYNVLQLTAGSVGTAAILNVQYTNQYMSF